MLLSEHLLYIFCLHSFNDGVVSLFMVYYFLVWSFIFAREGEGVQKIICIYIFLAFKSKNNNFVFFILFIMLDMLNLKRQ